MSKILYYHIATVDVHYLAPPEVKSSRIARAYLDPILYAQYLGSEKNPPGIRFKKTGCHK